MDARFASPVFPGESLTVKMWHAGDGVAFFQTFAGGDRLVLDGGRCVHV